MTSSVYNDSTCHVHNLVPIVLKAGTAIEPIISNFERGVVLRRFTDETEPIS